MGRLMGLDYNALTEALLNTPITLIADDYEKAVPNGTLYVHLEDLIKLLCPLCDGCGGKGIFCGDCKSGEIKRKLLAASAADAIPWSFLEEFAGGKRYNYASDFVADAKAEWERRERYGDCD